LLFTNQPLRLKTIAEGLGTPDRSPYRQALALCYPCERVFDKLLFNNYLRSVIEALDMTTAARPEMRTLRFYAIT